jgi:Ca-activated chloride channel homolog
MIKLLQGFCYRLPKPILFAILTAIGCLLMAMVGEIWLAQTQLPPPPSPPSHAVSLVIDTSGSMEGAKIAEVKNSAIQFINRREEANLKHLADDQIGIIEFNSNANILAQITPNFASLNSAINSLNADGGTAIDQGLNVAISQLQNISNQKTILMFTDGQSDPDSALNSAELAKQQGIRIVVVATNDADFNFLTQITGDSSLVFPTQVGQFEDAFQKAELAIYSDVLTPQIVISNTTQIPSKQDSLKRIGLWTALIAIGATITLIIAENIYLRRRFLTFKEGLIGVFGGLTVGYISGVMGQLIYTPELLLNTDLSKVISWTILGGLIGIGISLFIPNSSKFKALIGGTVGGGLGALSFVLIVNSLGDINARLLGATILGFFLGLMIILIDAFKEAWLIVHWNSQEKSSISLGSQPIILGCSDKAHIYLSNHHGFAPIVAQIYLQQQKIIYEDYQTKQKTLLKAGSKLKFLTTEIEVKTQK